MTDLEMLIKLCGLLDERDVRASQEVISYLSTAFVPYAKAYLTQGKHKPPHRCKSKFVRRLRLAFVSEAVGHFIMSTKDLNQKEAVYILRWLLGKHPVTNVHWDEDEIEAALETRIEEVVKFLDGSKRVEDATTLRPAPRKKKAA